MNLFFKEENLILKKIRDFEPVHHQQLNKNSSRKQESESSDDEEIQAVKDNNYSNNIFGGSLPRNSSISEAKKCELLFAFLKMKI